MTNWSIWDGDEQRESASRLVLCRPTGHRVRPP